MSEFILFIKGFFQVLFKGGKLFYSWMLGLTVLISIGIANYIPQMQDGLIHSNMREQVSWGFYISNFTFLVGVAAAAVLLVIPAYLYHFKAIKKIVAFGECLAVTAVIMAQLFIIVDTGRPDRLWHAIPGLGFLNLPSSILGWDMVVLNGYLSLNLLVILYLGASTFFGREPNKRFVIPFILLSIPWAIALHSVTAFVYNGLASRPFWNASILAPRFLASAFCAGPALMIIIFQILRKVMNFEIRNRAIFKLAEIVCYAMAINLFLLLAEVFKEFYSDTLHLAPMLYLFNGLHGHNNLVPWIWTAMALNTVGFLLFLIPKTRKNFVTLNIGCVMLFIGIWIEKGMGLIIPGFIPDALGEIYEYMPSQKEIFVTIGIWSIGMMLYTLLTRTIIAIETGVLRYHGAPPIQLDDDPGLLARDVMQKTVFSLTPDRPIEEIRSYFIEHQISGAPVVDQNNKVIGVVSHTDIVFSLINEEEHLFEKLKHILKPDERYSVKRTGNIASEVMTSPAITANMNTPVTELAEIISNNRIKRIIIVNDDGHPVGIVAQIDLVKSNLFIEGEENADFQI